MYKYLDSDGNELFVGNVVTCPGLTEDLLPGVILQIDDIDGDWSDELGGYIGMGPYAFVKWPEEDEPEVFIGTQPRLTWADYPHGSNIYYFDDLTRVDA